MSDEMNPVEPKRPGRPPQKKSPTEGSRISYNERNKLTVSGMDTDNYIYRVVNTDDEKYSGRLEKMKQIGYTIVNDGTQLGDESGVDGGTVGSATARHVGFGTKGVLMRIRKEFYQEDMAAKQARVDDTELGMVADELRNAEGMYGDGLKIRDGQGTRLQVSVRNK